MTSQADVWQEYAKAYEEARSRLIDGADAEAAVETYLQQSTALPSPEPVTATLRRGESLGGFFGWDYTRAVASAAADLDVALQSLRRAQGGTAAQKGVDGVASREADTSREFVDKPVDLASVFTDGPPSRAITEEEATREHLGAAVNTYFDKVVKDGATAVGDVVGFVTTVGMDKILAGAGEVIGDVAANLPASVRKLVAWAVRLINLAVKKFRDFLKGHFPELEKAITKWWKDTIGDKNFTAKVLGLAYGIEGLKELRAGDVEGLPENAQFGRGIEKLGAAEKHFDKGDGFVSTAADIASRAWPLLGLIPEAALVGGVLAAAMLTFVMVRGADYVDMETLGPLTISTWLDFVDGPTVIVAELGK